MHGHLGRLPGRGGISSGPAAGPVRDIGRLIAQIHGLMGVLDLTVQSFIISHSIVQGEDIDKDPLVKRILGMVLILQDRRCHGITQLGMAPQGPVVCILCLEEIWIGELLSGNFAELLILIPHHGHIDVIIPGYKALVADGSQHGPAVREEGQPVLFADPVQLMEQIQLHGPDLLPLPGDLKSPFFLRLKPALRYFKIQFYHMNYLVPFPFRSIQRDAPAVGCPSPV